jgi:nickel/cobalt transporter (NiCoT) family protein
VPRNSTRAGVIRLFAVLGAINAGAWVAVLLGARHFPLLLPLGVTAFALGLRHAVDPDHIAAIDGTTRKLMHEGKRAESVGFYFSLGHSTVVFLLAALVAFFGSMLKTHLPALHVVGLLVGTSVSVLFLLTVAVINIAILVDVLRKRANDAPVDFSLKGGALSKLLRPALGLVRTSAHMYPVGFLFGLGFDTATEIALLGISAASGASGMPMIYALVLPWLFTAGMSLVDTAEGVAMLGAYGWAYVQPGRRLLYNVNMTVLTIVIALFVCGAEAMAAMGTQHMLSFSWLGFGIIALFAANVVVSAILVRLKP